MSRHPLDVLGTVAVGEVLGLGQRVGDDDDEVGDDPSDSTEGKVASGLNTAFTAGKSLYDLSKKKKGSGAAGGTGTPDAGDKDKDKKKKEDTGSDGNFFTAYHSGLPTYAWMGIGVGGLAVLYMIYKAMKK